jgi:hypothetical protein
MALRDVLGLCIEKWRRDGITLSPPVGEYEVRCTWDGFGKQAAEDVIRLYSTVGGFANDEMDDEFHLSLWRWDVLREQNTQREGEGVMFCDHLIESIIYELRFEDHRQSSVWELQSRDADPVMIAPSLKMFFRLYLEDPWRLLGAWSPSDGDTCKK